MPSMAFIWIIQRDASTQLNSLLAGETHIADTVAGNDKDQVIEAEGFHITEDVGFFHNTLKLNTQGEYTSDPNVRRAIAHAMNYDALPEVQDVKITLLPGPTALNFPGAVDGLEIPAYDLELARAALAESPWPEGDLS